MGFIALQATLTDKNWLDHLPWVMLGLRSAPKEDLQCSAAELVFGQPSRVPGEFLTDASACWPMEIQHPSFQNCAGGFSPVCPGRMLRRTCAQLAMYSSATMPTILFFGLLMMAPFRSLWWGPRLSRWTWVGGHSEQVSVDLVCSCVP